MALDHLTGSSDPSSLRRGGNCDSYPYATTHAGRRFYHGDPAPQPANKATGATEKVAMRESGGRLRLPEEEINQPLTFELKNLDVTHPYLKQRGVSAKTINAYTPLR